jgi:hypothetical protein
MWVRENANIVEEELEKSDKKEGGGGASRNLSVCERDRIRNDASH